MEGVRIDTTVIVVEEVQDGQCEPSINRGKENPQAQSAKNSIFHK